MIIKGKIRPLKDRVLVTDMEFGEERTKNGLYIPSADGKTQGIMPRWGRVWAVGNDQKDIQIGEWILIEHGRWTRSVTVETEQGKTVEVRMVDNKAIMCRSDEKPSDIYRSEA